MGLVLAAWSAISSTFVASAFGQFLTTTIFGRLLTSVALSALKAALMKQPKSQQPGIRTQQTQTGGITPASFILGRYATEGQLAAPTMSHTGEGGAPNTYLTYVIELGDIPGQTLESLILDGEEVPIEGIDHADYGRPIGGRFADQAWIKYYDGTQTSADPMLVDKYGADPDRPWTAEMVGNGICYAVLTFKFKRDVFTTFPSVRFVVGGIPLYDPRKDTSVGGDGSHRWADASTWEVSENVAVQTYNIMRGIDLGGGHKWGGDAAAEDLPLAVWWAAMNKADLEVDLEAGGTEPQYRASYEVFVDDEPGGVIEDILRGAVGEVSEVGGVWKIRLGGPNLPVYFFTDDDVIITEDDKFAPFTAGAAPVNGVSATYPDPASLWEPRDAPPRFNDTYEAEDGGQRNVGALTLSATPYPTQVQRVMRNYVEDERRFRRHTLTLPSDAVPLEPLDSVSWASDRFGYGAKAFEINANVDPLLTGTPRLTLREVDPADESWTTGYELPVALVPTIVSQPAPQTVTGFAVVSWGIPNADGTNVRPALRLSWNGDQPDVRGLRWELELADTTPVTFGSTQSVASGALVISEGVLSGTTYRIRARFVVNRPTIWSDWLSVTTSDIRLSIADLDNEVQAAFERHDVALEDADGTLGALRDAVLTSIGPLDVPVSLKDSIMAAYGPLDVAASLTDRIVDAYGPLDPEISLDDRVTTLTGNYILELPERADTVRQLDLLAERLLAAALDHAQTRKTLSRAGVVVDEVSGRVTIEGVVQTQDKVTKALLETNALNAQIEQSVTKTQMLEEISRAVISPEQVPVFEGLSAQINSVRTILDGNTAAIELKADAATVDAYGLTLGEAVIELGALNAELDLRVTQTDFTAVSDRVTEVETSFSALDGAGLSTVVSDVRSLYHDTETIHENTLEGLLDAFRSRKAARTDLAIARQDLTARTVAGEQSVAALKQSVAVSFDNTTALIQRESAVRAAELAAQATITDSLRADLVSTDGALAGTAEAVSAIEGRVEQTEDGLDVLAQRSDVLTSRIESETGDRAGAIAAAFDTLIEKDLRALLDDHNTRKKLDQGIAQAKNDMFANVLENREALAGVRQEFTAAIGDVDARASRTTSALATETRARIEDVTALSGRVGTTEGQIEQINTVDVDSESALVQAYLGLVGEVGEAVGKIDQLNTVDVDSESALVQAYLGLVGEVGEAVGKIDQLNTVDVDSESALVQAYLGLVGEVGEAVGKIDQLNTVDVDSESALVQAYLGLVGEVGEAAGKIDEINTVDVDSESALVQAFLDLNAQVTDPETGLAITRAGVTDLTNAFAGAEDATAERFEEIEAAVGDPTANPPTGFHGAIENLGQVVGDVDSGLVRDVSLLNAQIFTGGDNTIKGDLGTVRQIVGNEDAGLVSVVQELSVTLANVDGELVGGTAFDALFAEVTETGGELTALTARQSIIDATLGSGNLLPDPALTDPNDWELEPRWVLEISTVTIQNQDETTTVKKIGGELVYTGGASVQSARTVLMTATADTVYTVRFNAQSTSAGATSFGFRVEFENASGTVLPLPQTVARTMQDGTHRYDGAFTAPATATAMRLVIAASGSGNARLSAISISEDWVRGEIETLEATRVTPDGAVSAVEQRISARYGDLEGLAEDTAFAKAGIDGISSGYVWRLNGQNLLELVSVSQGTDQETASTFRIAADYVQITGLAQIDSTVIASLAASDALIDNLSLGRGQIEDTLASDNYAETAQGVPTAGMKLDFATGEIKAFGPVISRQIAVATGSKAIPAYTIATPISGADTFADDWAESKKTYWVDQTEIPMAAWQQPNKIYLVTAALRASVNSSGLDPDVYWGVVGQIMPMTKWSGNQSLRIKLDVWSRNSTGWSAGFIDWTIYEVT